jgi:hypothetical protein
MSAKRAFRPRPIAAPEYPTHDDTPTRRGALARLGSALGAMAAALCWPERAETSSRRPAPPQRKPKKRKPKPPKRSGKKKPRKPRRPPVYDGMAFAKPAPGDLELPRD